MCVYQANTLDFLSTFQIFLREAQGEDPDLLRRSDASASERISRTENFDGRWIWYFR